MPAVLGKIYNVRVDATLATAIERRVAQVGGSVSDFLRDCLHMGVGAVDLSTPNSDTERRHRADELAALAQAATDLRRLGNFYVYAVKASRPVSPDEDMARLAALHAVCDAARALLR